jgi:diadenosine tetraphosphate (Ap4A) HIT family hydrolase
VVGVTDCYSCDTEARLDSLPARERVWAGEHWRIAHAFGTSLGGWLVVLPRRHTTRIAEHTPDEAAELGALLVAASQALESVTGCAKTYVAQFAEAEGFEHVHFHVIPRPASLPDERRGPRIFGLLGVPHREAVSEADRDDLAGRLHVAIAASLGTAGGRAGPGGAEAAEGRWAGAQGDGRDVAPST